MNTFPLPPHFQPDTVGAVWRVPYQERVRDAIQWRKTYATDPIDQNTEQGRDSTDYSTVLLLIDIQNTFCIPDFELFVGGRSGRGAIDDNRRLCEFIYRNLANLTQIIATLDTHTAIQIFHPIFWINASGDHPDPYTVISLEHIQEGQWQVNPAIAPHLMPNRLATPETLQTYVFHYAQQLQEKGQYPLTIWPYHSMLGGIGHALVSAVEEAIFFHSQVRQCQPRFEIKGQHPLTENYSVLSPEVITDSLGRAIAHKNVHLMDQLLNYDRIVIAGQAKSHCVAWTLETLLQEIQSYDPTLAQTVYLLEDCMSPVVVPGLVDYSDITETTFQRFAAAGMHRIQSTLPMSHWP